MLALPEAYVSLVRTHRLLSSVRALVLRDLGVIVIDKERVNVRRGDEVNLPLWLALELHRSGYAELRDIALRDVELLKYYHMERTSKGGKLADVREDLYFSAEMAVARLSEDKATDMLAKAERFKGTLNNLVDLRMSKIVSAAVNLEARQASDVSKIAEEMILYRVLRKLLGSWRSSVLKYGK